MRIAFVSDIHGNLAALEAVVADIRHRGVDRIVNLGDSLSGPLLPLETARYLRAAGWITLAGNHERHLLTLGPGQRGPSDEYAYSQLGSAEFDWLRTLAPACRLSAEIFGCHGTPASDRVYFLETIEDGRVRPANPAEVEARLGEEPSVLVACGHSHLPRVVRSRRGQLVVNPGSVGLPAYEDDDPLPHVIETGSPDARYAIVEKSGSGWIVSLLTVPYDHEAMARLAGLRHRPEWEHALLTGSMPGNRGA